MIVLRDQQFAPVWNASGARGFFGEGRSTHEYWHHRPLMLDYTGSTFVAKTTTTNARAGNMSLDDQFRPTEWIPRCIVVRPREGVVLNAVGLSGPGADSLLSQGKWQQRLDPFFISYMAVGERDQQLADTRLFFEMLRPHRDRFRVRPGLQLNFSCPNTEHAPPDIEGILLALDAYRDSGLDMPVVVKLNALFPIKAARTISEHSTCDAITCSNTIPWGRLPERIDWQGLFRSDGSPLSQFGGGGLSGKPLTPLVAEWISMARQRGIAKPIIACGGILSCRDIDWMARVGASGVELGSVALLRPWRIRSMIRHARTVFGETR